jgi:hypothetical protein
MVGRRAAAVEGLELATGELVGDCRSMPGAADLCRGRRVGAGTADRHRERRIRASSSGSEPGGADRGRARQIGLGAMDQAGHGGATARDRREDGDTRWRAGSPWLLAVRRRAGAPRPVRPT